MSDVAESTGSTAVADSGNGSEHSEASQPSPDSAASIRPVPGQPRSAAQREADGQEQPGEHKESRYERTKRERAEWKAKADQREAAQARREQMFAEERAKFEESKKPKRNYTLAQLRQYRHEWAQEAQQGVEGREDLVMRADQAIQEMEAEERASNTTFNLPRFGTKEHKKIWEDSEVQIRQEDPEFGTPGTRIDTKLREVLSGPNAQMYRDHAYGIFAAYAEAQKEILKEDNTVLKKEVESLKAENAQLQGLTSIGGGVPGRLGAGKEKDFASLTSAEMRKRLMSTKSRSSFLPML